MTTSIVLTERTALEILGPEHAELMLRYYRENIEHLRPWEPDREEQFFTLPHWEEVLGENQLRYETGAALKFSALDPGRGEVIGICNFSNIVRGVFQACHMGYSIARKYEGQGLMLEILNAGMGHVFQELGLHRIMANHVPENHRSAALLERLGFEREGLAKSYLKIGGEWRDHVLTARINPGA